MPCIDRTFFNQNYGCRFEVWLTQLASTSRWKEIAEFLQTSDQVSGDYKLVVARATNGIATKVCYVFSEESSAILFKLMFG